MPKLVILFSHRKSFKEAKSGYSFNDIGKYFSALSNEANIRGFQEAWLIFGISDNKEFVGTEFRKQGNLQSLKREHESVCPLPMNKVDLIRSQIGMDWSKEIVEGASQELLLRGKLPEQRCYC